MQFLEKNDKISTKWQLKIGKVGNTGKKSHLE